MAILGIDEVGRGPLAGPLVIGAVIMPEEEKEWFTELKDSKKLAQKKREVLSEIIWQEAAAVGLGWVSAEELDNIGISEALRLATKRAVKSAQELHASFSQIVIDGKVNFLAGTALEKFVTTVVKADDLIREVSAASIVAKVARDKYMIELAEKYPEYGFEKHVGYGTAKHREAINRFGICPEHRKSFEPIRSLVGFQRSKVQDSVVKNTTKIGNKGEDATVEYLKKQGHRILERNHKTPVFEIDVISILGDKIYFTEVKYRKNDDFGGGVMAINDKKLRKMRLGAESYMKERANLYSKLNPVLAVADVSGKNFKINDWFMVH